MSTEEAQSDMPHVRHKDGISLIATERQRQIMVEGYTLEHDDTHEYGEIAFAGACYAELAGKQRRNLMRGEGTMQPMIVNAVRDKFPWLNGFKPSPDPLRNLQKAGALIAAEIDRLLRKAKPEPCCERDHDKDGNCDRHPEKADVCPVCMEAIKQTDETYYRLVHVGCCEKKPRTDKQWTVVDVGGIGTRDIWCEEVAICEDMPPIAAHKICTARNAAISLAT